MYNAKLCVGFQEDLIKKKKKMVAFTKHEK